jgi:hypothetical protein
MVKLPHFPIILIFLASFFLLQNATALKNEDGSEEWGYVQVRPSKSFCIIPTLTAIIDQTRYISYSINFKKK